MFTDGLSEAVDGEGEEFGEERVAELSRCTRQLSAEALRRGLLEQVTEFCAGGFEDDAPSWLWRFQRKDDRTIVM